MKINDAENAIYDQISKTKKIDKVIRTVMPPNPLHKRDNITLIETRVRMDHFPALGRIKLIIMNNFDDVTIIHDKTISLKMWCEICASGRIHRHFHYTGSMNHYTS